MQRVIFSPLRFLRIFLLEERLRYKHCSTVPQMVLGSMSVSGSFWLLYKNRLGKIGAKVET